MAALPYVTAPGNIARALEGIQKAAQPDKVTGDFVKNILKIPGGSGDQITSFLKKIGFANTDGTPTNTYTTFRNPSTSGTAVAEAIRKAYAPLYNRNEYMHVLSDEELLGLVVEETGKEHDSNAVKSIVSAIKALKVFADFDQPEFEEPVPALDLTPQPQEHPKSDQAGIGLNLGYTINLNLPATSDIEVFNAIFKSLKQHMLSSEDG